MTADLACSSLVRRIRFVVQVPADMVESCDMTYPACANAVSTAVANTASLVLADTRFRNPMRTARASTSLRQPLPSTRPFTFLRIRFVRTKWKEWRVHQRHGQLPVRLTSMATWRILHGAHVRTCSSSTRRTPKETATRTRSRAFRTMPRGKGRSRGSTWQGRDPRLWRWRAREGPPGRTTKICGIAGRNWWKLRVRCTICRQAWHKIHRDVLKGGDGEACRTNLRTACAKDNRGQEDRLNAGCRPNPGSKNDVVSLTGQRR